MSIAEAIALWIKAKADALSHRHDWVPLKSTKEVYEGHYVGDSFCFTCSTCEKSKIVKT